jgi:multiple sugar transport system permease protein
MIPWVDYRPAWLGWRSLGLSPETIGAESTVREQFMQAVLQLGHHVAVGLDACGGARQSLAAYGLSRFSYKFGFMRNPTSRSFSCRS